MSKTTTIGIDLAKRVFHVCVLSADGAVIERRRLTRDRVTAFVAGYPGATVALEACGGAQYWARLFQAEGHPVRLLAPHVVKGYVAPGKKNDWTDAEAIAEAATRVRLKGVAVKTTRQQDLQCLHRSEELFVRQRTQIINALRGLLFEYGIVLPKGPGALRRRYPELALSTQWQALSAETRRTFDGLFDALIALDERIAEAKRGLRTVARQDPEARRLKTAPGIGPMAATALIAAVGEPSAFASARHFASWLGLVPRQHSSGGVTRLGPITKRGNKQLRTLLIIGAQSMLQRYAQGRHGDDPLAVWARRLLARTTWNKAVVALANKLARIVWRLMVSGETYRPRPAG